MAVAQPDVVSDTDTETEFDDVAELVTANENDALPLIDPEGALVVDVETDALDVDEDWPTNAIMKTQHISCRT